MQEPGLPVVFMNVKALVFDCAGKILFFSGFELISGMPISMIYYR